MKKMICNINALFHHGFMCCEKDMVPEQFWGTRSVCFI